MSDARHAVSDVDVDLGQLFGSLARNWLRILLAALVVAGLAYVASGFVTSLYRAETRILIESRESVYTRPASAGIAESERGLLDDETVASQVEVIGSTDILREVARKLDLASRAEFGVAGETSMLGNLMILAGLKEDPSQASVEERVLRAMQQNLSIYRVAGSRVIVIGFSSRDPALAAAVPNAIADAYVAGQEQAKRLSNADASEWLQPEIDDLRQRVRQAEAKVAEYRAEAGLLMGQNNAVLPTQQLAEISTELSRVRAERATAEARAAAIRDAVAAGGRVEAMPEVLAAPMVQRLRERQVQLEADLADLSASLLGNHPRIKALRAQLDETARQLAAEVRKVQSAAQNEAATARTRESQLVAEVNRLKAASAQAGGDEVELRALEREAAAQRALLESYLTRYREAAARADRNSMPADVRVFARATAPHEAYFPKVGLIVAAAFAATLLAMAIAILLAELFSGRAMRPAAGFVEVPEADAATAELVEAEPAAPEPVATPEAVLAATLEPVEELAEEPVDEPAEEPVEKIAQSESGPGDESGNGPEIEPESEDDMAMARLRPDEIAVSDAADRLIDSDAGRVVFVSPEGDEATAVSVTVAREMADAGLRVVFLDLTWSGAPSAAMLDDAPQPGITDLLAAQARFADVVHGDLYSDCHVIPAGTADRHRAMQAAERLPMILEALDSAYDIVVVECGATDAEAIEAVAGEDAQVLVCALDPRGEAVAALGRDLEAAGYGEAFKVTFAGRGRAARRGRFAA